jgi:hypothetical protein
MDEHDEDCEESWVTPARLRWWDIAPVVLSLPVALLQATTRWGEAVCQLLVGDAAARDAEIDRASAPILAVTQ